MAFLSVGLCQTNVAAASAPALSDQRGSGAAAVILRSHEPQISSKTALPVPLLQLVA